MWYSYDIPQDLHRRLRARMSTGQLPRKEEKEEDNFRFRIFVYIICVIISLSPLLPSLEGDDDEVDLGPYWGKIGENIAKILAGYECRGLRLMLLLSAVFIAHLRSAHSLIYLKIALKLTEELLKLTI